MKRPTTVLAVLCAVAFSAARPTAEACTNFLVTKGASADGSTMITYSADSHEFYGELYYRQAAQHPPGVMRDVYEWDTGTYLGQIPEAPVTHARVGNMNEHQVSVGETTWGGRKELRDPDAILDYGSLMYIALERARTAREAIRVMTGLVAEHGYFSKGESFSIADPHEVWILEMIGKGEGRTGAVWVARQVPDGMIAGHANAARIRQFPLDQPETTLYAPDVITFAREMGYFDGPDEEFSFADAYNPDNYGDRRFCDARVWCMYERVAAEQEVPSDWVLGEADAEPLPLWVEPDRPLTVADVMGLMRDHFEGTELDMTLDPGAGPHRLPYRWRPLTWELDGEEYFNERAVSTQQTGFSFVAQARAELPDPIGGVLWFGVDDTYSTAYVPFYAGVTGVPRGWAEGTGSFDEASLAAAFWVFNQVSNHAYLRYDAMIADIRKVQQELEGAFIAEQAEVDAAALALYERSPRLARDYLTEYSGAAGEEVLDRWRELYRHLLWKYLDGNVRDEHGDVTHPPYPEEFYRMVVAATGDRLKMKKMPAELEVEAERTEELAKLRRAILALLGARGIAVDASFKEKLDALADAAELEAWLVRAATAETVAEMVGE